MWSLSPLLLYIHYIDHQLYMHIPSPFRPSCDRHCRTENKYCNGRYVLSASPLVVVVLYAKLITLALIGLFL